MKESAGLKSSSDEEVVMPPKTPSTQYFTPKRKSSIANSLRKVSAARKMTVSQVLEEQEVNVVSPPKKGPVIRKSPAKNKVNLNNSRAPPGKVVKAGKKVLASGGRGITPGSGSSTGSNSLMKSRSRMNIIEKAGRTTPIEKAGRTTPIEKAGRTTPLGSGPTNLRTGVTSFLPQKPKGPTLEEIQDKKEEERRMKEQREVEARLRREEQMKQKADDLKRQREERMKRVKEAREKNENQKEKELSKKREEKETQEKLAVLKKKEEKHKEAERKRKEAEKKENDERLQKEEEERLEREELERKKAEVRLEEEKRREKQRQEQLRKEEEQRRMEEKRAYAAREKERILREQEEMRKLNSQNSAPKSDLNSTYNKPGDVTFNKTQTFDQSISGPQSYDITPARCELPPPPPQSEDNYGLDDLRSDSETDDEDNPKKQVPKWAEGTQLRTALLKQCYMGPDVDNIFFRIEDPDLSLMFNQQKKRYFKRTSSACWDSAPQSFNFKRV